MKTLDNPELARCIGKKTSLKILWRDWKKEKPKSGESIYCVIRLKNGYYALFADYIDAEIEAAGPFKKSRWQEVRFRGAICPSIFFGSKEEKRLVAWGYLEREKKGVLVEP